MKPLVVLSTFSTLLLAQHAPENSRNPFAGDARAIAAGAKLYEQTCQSCHGGEGRGDRAPALNSGRFARGAEDGEIFLNIRNGIGGTQMPPFAALGSDAAWHLVAYIRSLSGAPEKDSPEFTVGDAAAGQSVFFGKAVCAGCHEVNGHGGVTGPDLSTAGRSTAASLAQKILTPDSPLGRGRRPQMIIVKTRDGREIHGVRLNEDTFSLQLRDAAGELHLLDKRTLAPGAESVRTENRSLMPGDYGKRLTASELRDLVAYLKTLTSRDLAKTAAAEIPGPGLTFERLRNSAAEPHNWFTYWGDYQGKHYSSLSQINLTNVRQLQARWALQMPGDSILEATPVVIDGVMYTAGPPGQVFALDARTGRQLWKYQRTQKVVNPYESNRFNRGVAVLGNRVFFGTLDAALVALDARTGLPLWEVQVADTKQGYSITEAPLAVKDRIVIGVAGGEYGIRGFVDAYDAATGKRAWRFHTIPGPGEFGHESWKGDSWQQGGGATWLTGSYDPELDLLYWGVGNPGPDMDGEVRHGDNLFSCSVVALDPATGRRKWHFQFTPADTHDWDANEDLVLVDRVFAGEKRKLLLQANRNGFYYVLDRTNGKFLRATPFVRQTWSTGFDENGRPKLAPGTTSSADGSVPVYPDLGGGTNFQSPSLSAQTGWMYVEYQESGQRFFRSTSTYEAGREYWGGRAVGLNEPTSAGIRAINHDTGKIEWDFKISQGSLNAGLLATGGGLVFAATREGNLIALDAKTGKSLWNFQAGAGIAAAPMSYAIHGQQFIAVSAGNVLYSFALPE